MSRPPARTRRRAHAVPDPSLRHVWLASLGALVVARRALDMAARLARQELERRVRPAKAR